MKPATISHLKQELKNRSHEEMLEICLRLGRFKKENKELLSYLLFEVHDEQAFIESIKLEIDQQFREINKSNIYFIKKSIRKILRATQKFIRYSGCKQTEVELLLHFCRGMKQFKFFMEKSVALNNIYIRQIQNIKKSINTLHEDLQYDYGEELMPLLALV